MRILAACLIMAALAATASGCRQVAPRLPPHRLVELARGPAVTVAALPGGGVIAGAGEQLWWLGRDGATASIAFDRRSGRQRLRDIRALAVGPAGRVAIADAGSHRVWEFIRTGAVDFGVAIGRLGPLAGAGTTFYPIGDGGPAPSAQLEAPAGVAWLADGSLVIADTGRGRIRRVGSDGRIATIAGTGLPAGTGEPIDGGPATHAGSAGPGDGGLTTQAGSVGPGDGGLTTHAGSVGPGDGGLTTHAESVGPGDGGPAVKAVLAGPGPLAGGPDGTLLVAETAVPRVRRVAPDGTITTLSRVSAAGLAIASAGVVFASVGRAVVTLGADGLQVVAGDLHSPAGLAVTPDGILVADGDRVVRLEPVGP